ncbi:lanthionine synthetase LanC family protein [Duganella radicis]|uniref:Lanthionine synthetase C family protein n=1 Tax=Duganella radicis TaxID=551988 RepID=A0A6L6PQ79_9BURK|nr:lanthionine synthetase LanC family protein [Duganella radicis]MTV41153.1 hypothetical protein [Duganella radicis]
MYIADYYLTLNAITRIEACVRSRPSSFENLSLCAGESGIALFYAKLAKFDPSLKKVSDEILERILGDCADSKLLDVRFFPGLTGVGFVVQHCNANPVGSMEDANEDLDELLIELLSVRKWQGPYDLIYGLVGLGVYAITSSGKNSQRILDLVVEALLMIAYRGNTGLTWMTPPRFQGFESRNSPQGKPNINVGLAHGIPGIIGMCAMAIDKGHSTPELVHLLEASTGALLRCRLPQGFGSTFGYVSSDNTTSRVAWCYGDLGNALMLVRSGKALQDTSIVEVGHAIATSVLKRKFESMRIFDHALCHGTAGVALLFSALHRETGDASFQHAAIMHYGNVLSDIEIDVERLASMQEDQTRKLEYGLLTGLAGIGMSLMDAMDDKSDGWSKWMLV